MQFCRVYILYMWNDMFVPMLSHADMSSILPNISKSEEGWRENKYLLFKSLLRAPYLIIKISAKFMLWAHLKNGVWHIVCVIKTCKIYICYWMWASMIVCVLSDDGRLSFPAVPVLTYDVRFWMLRICYISLIWGAHDLCITIKLLENL